MSMQTIEPFGSYDDEWRPNPRTVTLKEGIDLAQLHSGEGTVFELDPSGPLPGGGEQKEAEEQDFDREEVLRHLNFDCIDIGGEEEADSDEAASPFQRLAVSMEDLSGDRGVLKKQLQVGIGESVPEKALVRVHYNGYLEYADEPYDSSRLRGKQQQFVLGRDEVIEGWEVAVKSMRRNERSQFLISPKYAFGEVGCPPRIPANATILFEIELLGFVDYSAVEDLEDLSHDQGKQATFQQRLAAANSEREVGNDFFQQNMIGKAVGRYLKAIRQLEPVRLKGEEEEEVWRVSLKKLYLNLSLCNLKQRKSQLALSNCRRVLELDGKNVKALFRIGQAYMQLGDFASSKKHLVRAGKLSPGSEEIRQELKKLDNVVKRFKSMEKSMYTNMFQQQQQPEATGEAAEGTEETAEVPAHHSRDLLLSKLRVLQANPNMLDLVLPNTLGREELACAEEVAKELGLKTEKNPASGIRIYKPGVQPEDFEQYL